MIVNMTDLQKYDVMGHDSNDNDSNSSSPTNEALNKTSSSSTNLTLKTKMALNTKSNEQDYTEMARAPQYAKTRRNIVLSVTIGIIIILIGLIMYVSHKPSVQIGGIIIMSFGVLVIICGVLWARFHTPPVQYFNVEESL